MKENTPHAIRQAILRMPIAGSLHKGFEAKGWTAQLPQVYDRTLALYRENAGSSKALKTHLRQLLPMIALYEAAQTVAGSKEAAMAFVEEWAFVDTVKMVKRLRPLMKLGLYRLMPTLCGLMLDRVFGESAGFTYRLVPNAPPFAADMLRCPYLDTLTKYGCPELTKISCKADDITYGDLHPRLVWGRTQTLACGGSCCDFRLCLKKQEQRRKNTWGKR